MRKIEELRPEPTCSRPGCNKPTWNRQPNEYCSKACRPPQCSKLGCDKPTWNGRPGEYCSHACRQADSYFGGGLYSGFGSNRQQAPSYLGNGSYGSYNHAGGSFQGGAGAPNVCRRSPYCTKPTWNGNPNEYCKSCQRSYGGVGSSGAGVMAGNMIVNGGAGGASVAPKLGGAAVSPKPKPKTKSSFPWWGGGHS